MSVCSADPAAVVSSESGGSKGRWTPWTRNLGALHRASPHFFLEILMGIEDDFVKQQLERERREQELEDFCTQCLLFLGLVAGLALIFLVMYL